MSSGAGTIGGTIRTRSSRNEPKCALAVTTNIAASAQRRQVSQCEKKRAPRQRSARAARDPEARLRALAFGYVRFAEEQPARFRLAFGATVFTREHPELREAGVAAYTMLRDAVASCQLAGVVGGRDPDEAALLCWSTVHGFASLVVDGQVARGALEPVLAGLFAGLTPRVGPSSATPPR